MSKPVFVVSVADLERGPKAVTWSIPDAWLRETLEGTTAEPRNAEGTLEAELSKNGQEVLVRGTARVQVTMPCVVSLEPLDFDLTAEILLMLRPAPSAPTPPRATGKGRLRAVPSPAGEAAPARKGKPRTRSEAWEDAIELSTTDAAQDTFEGDKVVLDTFVRDFILLELPLYPRRYDLPSAPTLAIAPPSPPAEDTPARVDPRLLPLAAIASRLREQKKD